MFLTYSYYIILLNDIASSDFINFAYYLSVMQ